MTKRMQTMVTISTLRPKLCAEVSLESETPNLPPQSKKNNNNHSQRCIQSSKMQVQTTHPVKPKRNRVNITNHHGFTQTVEKGNTKMP